MMDDLLGALAERGIDNPAALLGQFDADRVTAAIEQWDSKGRGVGPGLLVQMIRKGTAPPATVADPARLTCRMCSARHTGYHPTPGIWPYCTSAYCATCCRHPGADDDPKTFDDIDRRGLVRAKSEATRLKAAGLL